MDDGFAVVILFYLMPLLPLALTWRQPLGKAMGWIALGEGLNILLFLSLGALVELLGWQWYRWGQVSVGEILSFWQGEALPAPVWIWPGIGETALFLLARWVVDLVRQQEAEGEGYL